MALVQQMEMAGGDGNTLVALGEMAVLFNSVLQLEAVVPVLP